MYTKILKKYSNFVGEKMAKIRLDKFIAESTARTRSEAKKIIKQKRVAIDGITVSDEGIKVDENAENISVDGKNINYEKNIYLMLNKPSGVISVTKDNKHKTVIDLTENNFKGLFPVGRLDIDTEGLLILTNDGDFAHNTLSPKKHVTKKYIADVSGISYCDELKKDFENGVVIDDGYKCRPSKLEYLGNFGGYDKFSVEISEGKFHQIKKMFAAHGGNVIYLKRISFGEIQLDESLDLGKYRRLNEREMEYVDKIRRQYE